MAMKTAQIRAAAKEFAAYARDGASKRAIISDFMAGASWALKQQQSVEETTVKNLELIGAFCDHIKEADSIDVPETTMVAFFEKD